MSIYNITDDTFISTGALAGKNPVKLRQYDNRIWAVCDDGSLVFSNNGDASTWDVGNIILLPNREPIIDFVPIQGGVIIPHRTGAYAFYGSGAYQDTTILPIQSSAIDQLLFTDSVVVVSNVVYILGNRSVYAVSLNGIKEIPHNQNAFFKANYTAWDSQSPRVIQGIYLYKFHAILYLFQSNYGSQGFLFYINTGAFCKINQSLPPDIPYMVELADSTTDFLIATDSTTISRSIYPSGVLTAARNSIIQLRHEDVESMRDKVWRSIGIQVEGPVYNVMVRAYLDYSDVATDIQNGLVDLVAGDNVINLYDSTGAALRSKAISIEIQIGNAVYLTDETTGLRLTDNPGSTVTTTVETITKDNTGAVISDVTTTVTFTANNVGYLTSDTPMSTPSSFAIRELRLKYREVGPMI